MAENLKELKHLAIIMDGNRRWAKSRGLSIKNGHRAGADTLSNTINWCIDFGIKYLTVYAFSTENWKRDPSEINDIMSLLREYLSSKEKEFNKNCIRVKAIGIENNVDKDIIEKVKKIEENTKNNNVLQVNIAFNYGGRTEVLDVVKKIAKKVQDGTLKVDDIDDKIFKENLYYGDIPDPDLVVRTGGEFRISNFLLWEIAYSEFYFTDVFWPDFSKELLSDIINNFKKRERRYGGTIKK